MSFQSQKTVCCMIALFVLVLGRFDDHPVFAQNQSAKLGVAERSDSNVYRHQTIFAPRDHAIEQISQSPQVPDILDAEARDALGIPLSSLMLIKHGVILVKTVLIVKLLCH